MTEFTLAKDTMVSFTVELALTRTSGSHAVPRAYLLWIYFRNGANIGP
jgi:hypothetical protein